MIFTEGPVYKGFATSRRAEKGSRIDFAMKPLAIARPGGLLFDAPPHFIGIDETPRSSRRANQPWKKLAHNAAGQVAGGFPTAPAGIGQAAVPLAIASAAARRGLAEI